MIGHMRILRQDDRYRLTYEAHFAVRKDRLVVECGTIVWARNDLLDVVDRDDMENARNGARGSSIHRFDISVSDRAAEYLGMQHAGKAHRVGVLRAPRDLVPA